MRSRKARALSAERSPAKYATIWRVCRQRAIHTQRVLTLEFTKLQSSSSSSTSPLSAGKSVSLSGGRLSAFFAASSSAYCVPRQKRARPPASSAARWPRRAAPRPRARASLGGLLGCNTRHAPQVRQRNCWRPQAFLPFLTMCALPQRVQRGTTSAGSEDIRAITQHRR